MKTSKIIGLIGGAYLGGIISYITKFTVLNWQWYVICVPIVIGYNIAIILAQNKR